MAIYGYTKNYKLIKPKYDTDTWHDYEYDNLDTIDAVLSAIYASGNWKGFWATNTKYVVGDVVIDRDTDTMYKVMVEHTTSGSTFAEEQTNHHDYYELWSPNNLAESWAIKTDGEVSNEDYSSKAYAISSGLISEGSAKEWAVSSGVIGSTGEYSAKKYATDAHNDYISMTTNANVIAVGSNINNMNAVGQSISSVNTVASNVSSVNTVAGVSTDVTAVSSIATAVSAVADNNTNVSTVATNISDVNTAATNIAAIQDAPNQASSAQNSAAQASQSATSAAQSAQTATNKADEASESAKLAVSALSLQIGDISFAPLGIDESLNLRRYLNGQVIIQSQFVAFTSKVKSAIALYPNLATTETNWQAEKTQSKLGQCGKFVIDDTAGTIRLPCVVNAQGLVNLTLIGGIKSESLPNIKGRTSAVATTTETGEAQGALYDADGNVPKVSSAKGNNWAGVRWYLDASRSSSTYKDNAPVQQEAIQYPYCIVVNTGVDEADRPVNNYQVNNVYSYGMSQYYKGTMNNNSWLKSAGQWNYGTVYTGMYQWLLEQMNAGVSGFVASTATYTDYDFIINTTDQTFRLPLKAELEVVPSGWNLYYYIGDTLQNAQLVNVARIEETVANKTDKVQAAEASMPSGKYIDLTPGASGTTYVAPANGWFSAMNGNGKNGFCSLVNQTKKIGDTGPAAQGITDGISFVPVIAGDTVVLRYNGKFNELNKGWFRFIYANGNQ